MKNTILSLLVLLIVTCVGCGDRTVVETDGAPEAAALKNVSVEEASRALESKKAQFVDVRTSAEYTGGHAAGAVNLPLDSLAGNLGGLDRERPVYVICESGRRSQKGAEILMQNGFREIYNVEGGTSAWTAAGLPTEK